MEKDNPMALLAARRFRVLVEQLRAEYLATHEAEHGFQTWAARKLGVSGVYVGYALKGEREAKGEACVSAMNAMGIDSRFFYDAKLGDAPRYTDHLRWKSTPEAAMPAAWDEFVTTYVPRLHVEPDEIAWLREIRTHRATALSYLQALMIRRGGLDERSAAHSAKVTAEAAAVGEALGVPPFVPGRL